MKSAAERVVRQERLFGTWQYLGLAAVLIVTLALIMPALALAADPEPQVPSAPPRPPDSGPQDDVAGSRITALALPPLKAVLLVGPIDGDTGTWTTAEKANMDLAAAELQANGVVVHKFYAPYTNWEQIKAAANGAQFLLYRGHGLYMGSVTSPTVGGFALSNGTGGYQHVLPGSIRTDLDLAPNAIVMLYGCFTAGSSSSDPSPISSTEARRRVAQYSDPFFDIGAGGYFANWYGSAFQMFLRYLFQGQTQAQAYESYFDFTPSTVERYTHPDHPGMVMWLDKDTWGETQYNNAFAGLPNATLQDLFLPTAMQVSPGPFLRLAEPAYPAQHVEMLVTSTTNYTFTWTAAISPAVTWLSMQPTSGASGQATTLSITPTGLATGAYHTTLHLIASPILTETIADSQQTITVTLHVVDRVRQTYLPVIARP